MNPTFLIFYIRLSVYSGLSAFPHRQIDCSDSKNYYLYVKQLGQSFRSLLWDTMRSPFLHALICADAYTDEPRRFCLHQPTTVSEPAEPVRYIPDFLISVICKPVHFSTGFTLYTCHRTTEGSRPYSERQNRLRSRQKSRKRQRIVYGFQYIANATKVFGIIP